MSCILKYWIIITLILFHIEIQISKLFWQLVARHSANHSMLCVTWIQPNQRPSHLICGVSHSVPFVWISRFRSMASTKAKRDRFIKSSIQLLRNYGFDGINLDWQFPTNSRRKFTWLCKVRSIISPLRQISSEILGYCYDDLSFLLYCLTFKQVRLTHACILYRNC